ncbi:SDR family NAD(P)-dependent oxidoreductase [uncultured Aeromicrobium sp.]|uniref:SDR family NAD(P)-dependent oxidoreductase n=1 Tax=uncultured Aeromicrobium sp. TaxID=337820 RepID=UPI0025E60C2B|nr:SDR family NAD(P)-dependent oxidoreductase [uncultured Aeromicrobium sp.]
MKGIDLTGRVAVVTGAASGLGQGIAMVLADHGATIVAIDRDDASATVAELDKGDGHQAVRADVSDHEAVARAFDEIDDVQQGVDILVNCAGIREIESVLDLAPAMWQRVLAVNLSGPFYCAQQAGRRMAEQGRGGAIVNVTSVAGLVGMTHRPAYTASKHGLVGLTRNLARDLSAHGIRVNAVAPGTVRTPLTEPYYRDEAFLRGVEGMVPLGFEGQPADVGRAVLFYASDLSSWITGTVLPVDGGWLAERNYAPPGATAYTSARSGSQEEVGTV